MVLLSVRTGEPFINTIIIKNPAELTYLYFHSGFETELPCVTGEGAHATVWAKGGEQNPSSIWRVTNIFIAIRSKKVSLCRSLEFGLSIRNMFQFIYCKE